MRFFLTPSQATTIPESSVASVMPLSLLIKIPSLIHMHELVSSLDIHLLPRATKFLICNKENIYQGYYFTKVFFPLLLLLQIHQNMRIHLCSKIQLFPLKSLCLNLLYLSLFPLINHLILFQPCSSSTKVSSRLPLSNHLEDLF